VPEKTSSELSIAEYHPLGPKIKCSMTRRGNPNWGKPMPFGPALPTEFELQVRHLRLTPEIYASSHEFTWCFRNKNRCCIPEWLLDAWDIPVDPDLSAA